MSQTRSRNVKVAVLFSSLLAMAALALMPEVALASGYTLRGSWRTIDSNHVKSYTFDYRDEVDCNFNKFTMRMDVSLGTVTASSAYIKTVKFVYTFYAANAGAIDGGGSVWDNFGHRSDISNNGQHYPVDGTSRTVTLNKTFNFNTVDPITIYKYDTNIACWYASYVKVGFNPKNPT